MTGLASAWAMARRRPRMYRHEADAATRCSGICPHTWPGLIVQYSQTHYLVFQHSRCLPCCPVPADHFLHSFYHINLVIAFSFSLAVSLSHILMIRPVKWWLALAIYSLVLQTNYWIVSGVMCNQIRASCYETDKMSCFADPMFCSPAFIAAVLQIKRSKRCLEPYTQTQLYSARFGFGQNLFCTPLSTRWSYC